MSSKGHVIIVGASELVLPAYQIVRDELGLGAIALDMNPLAPGMAIADERIVVSTKDAPKAVAEALSIAERLPVIGVFTCGADVEITVAAIAEALRLPGIPLAIAQLCNNKLAMHLHLDQLGFTAKPVYRLVASLDEARQAFRDIGPPCVIKPLDNCASRGVQRVENPDDLASAYKLAVDFNGAHGLQVLIEECLLGSKHTVEMLTWQGVWHLLSIIDTHYISPRWPCEKSLNTTRLDKETQERLFAFAKDVAQRIGVSFSAHKVDVNLTPDGDIQLIELTARLSGGFHCQYASPLAYGSHDIRAALKLSVGDPLDLEDIRHRYERGAAVCAILPVPGKIIAIEGVENARQMPGIAEVFIWRQPGETVGPYRNSADRPGFVIAAGSDADEAVNRAAAAAAVVRFVTSAE